MGHHDWVFHTWLHTGKNSICKKVDSDSSFMLKSVFVLSNVIPVVLVLGPCQTSKTECLVKIVNGFYPLTIFAKRSIIDIWMSSEYASDICVFRTLISDGFRWYCTCDLM